MRYNDYSSKIKHLDFKYDEQYYPDDEELPDPQINPIIPGAKVPLDKVGVTGVDLPIRFLRRDGSIQDLHVRASLYGSLDNPEAKGLNLSRFPIIMHEEIANHMSIEGLKNVLLRLQEKQNSGHVYCKLRFKYPWVQKALRTRKEIRRQDYKNEDDFNRDLFKTVEGVHLSREKMEGYIFYDCILEGQLHNVERLVNLKDSETTEVKKVNEFKFFLTVDYIYSSTCPCSFELARDATMRRGKAANGHSQRSVGRITVQFDPSKHIVWIEDIVEMARTKVPTEVVVICKRRDEQSFAELNGANLLFTEDSSRLLYEGLDDMYHKQQILDFSIVTEHMESLHPWSATAVVSKGIPGGLR